MKKKVQSKEYVPSLKKRYYEQVIPTLQQQFGYKNALQVPRLLKIVVNATTAEATRDAKVLDRIAADITTITGQHPVRTKARKSIAGFKLRVGMPLGCMVTLRKTRMYEFFERLVSIVLPRVRDFRGISPRGFDQEGNYTLGLKEQIIFPEINYDSIDKIRGLNIAIVTTAKTKEEGRALLAALGMPFRK